MLKLRWEHGTNIVVIIEARTVGLGLHQHACQTHHLDTADDGALSPTSAGAARPYVEPYVKA